MNYVDFELEIQPGSGGEYPLSLLRSPAGEARATMRFPFDQAALERSLDKLQIAILRSGGQRRRVRSPEESGVQEFGQALFDALFTGEICSRYEVTRERAAQQEAGVRIKLRVTAPELASLPWEFLYDPSQGEYVCLSRNTPLVRYLALDEPISSMQVTPPLRILGMIASPTDQASLDVAREKQRVEAAISRLRGNGMVELTWLEGQTWRDLQRAMRGGPWHIFHLVGHGAYDVQQDEGLVVLADDDGHSEYVSATQLARLLADHRSLRLVVLNACEGATGGKQDIFSSTASILVRRDIPAVVAMQYEITDEAAIEFGRAFYEALADGMPVDAAVSEARKAVSLEMGDTFEWATPVLYMQTPDGVIFDVAKTRPAESKIQEVKAPQEPAPALPARQEPRAGRPRWLWGAVGGAVVLLAAIAFALTRTGSPGASPPAGTSAAQVLSAATVAPAETSAPQAAATPASTASPSAPPAVLPTLAPAAPTVAAQAPTTAANPGNDLVVYGDAPAARWGNWSWETHADFANAAPVRSGSDSIAFTYEAGPAKAGFSLASPEPIDTARYAGISFWIYGPPEGGAVSFYIERTASDPRSEIQLFVFEPGAGEWTQIVVPWAKLGNPARIRRLNWQNEGFGANTTLYLDDIRLVSR